MNGRPFHPVATDESPRSRLSHEVRTRLTAVQLFMSLVADGSAGTLNPDQVEHLEVAARNLAEVKDLTERILALTAVPEGQQ